MGRQQHFAGLHLVQWYRFEPRYKWEGSWLEKIEPKTSEHQSTKRDEKATTRLTDTVYEKTSGRTATIVDVAGDRITLVFDDNNIIKKYEKKAWISKVPFGSVGKLEPIYAKVGDTQSYICIRFGNIIDPIWVEGYLVPFVADENTVDRITVNEKEAVIVDEFNQNIERNGTKYSLYAAIPETSDGVTHWAEYYTTCLQAFKKRNVNYIAIPYVYDICNCDKKDNVVRIAFNTVIAWMEKNPDYVMQVVFLCANINEYKNYRKLIPSLNYPRKKNKKKKNAKKRQNSRSN